MKFAVDDGWFRRGWFYTSSTAAAVPLPKGEGKEWSSTPIGRASTPVGEGLAPPANSEFGMRNSELRGEVCGGRCWFRRGWFYTSSTAIAVPLPQGEGNERLPAPVGASNPVGEGLAPPANAEFGIRNCGGSLRWTMVGSAGDGGNGLPQSRRCRDSSLGEGALQRSSTPIGRASNPVGEGLAPPANSECGIRNCGGSLRRPVGLCRRGRFCTSSTAAAVPLPQGEGKEWLPVPLRNLREAQHHFFFRSDSGRRSKISLAVRPSAARAAAGLKYSYR